MAKRKRKLPDPPPNADDPAQSRAFIRKAREFELDESPGAMDRAFEKVMGKREKKTSKGFPPQQPECGPKRKSD
jgi:hypothetical protein